MQFWLFSPKKYIWPPAHQLTTFLRAIIIWNILNRHTQRIEKDCVFSWNIFSKQLGFLCQHFRIFFSWMVVLISFFWNPHIKHSFNSFQSPIWNNKKVKMFNLNFKKNPYYLNLKLIIWVKRHISCIFMFKVHVVI